MVGQVTVDWGKWVGIALWGMSVACLLYVTVAYLLGGRGLSLLVIGAWGLITAVAGVGWTLGRSVALATDRVLTMLDRPDDPPLRAVRRGQG